MILQAAERTWNIRFDLEGGTDMKENAWLSYSEEQKAELEALAVMEGLVSDDRI